MSIINNYAIGKSDKIISVGIELILRMPRMIFVNGLNPVMS